MVTMRKRLMILVLPVVCLALIMPGSAVAAGKIGFFDFETVLQKSRAGLAAQDEMKREADKLKTEFEDRTKAYRTAMEDLDKKKSTMDEATRNKKMKELEPLRAEAEKVAMEMQGKSGKLRNDIGKPIGDKVTEIVKKIGKDDKYDFILELGKFNVVYFNDSFDLTNRIIQELDKSGPAKK
jgi:outer membrane protein